MSLEISWQGEYIYDGAASPMTFKHMYIGATGDIFGNGSDDVGTFSISGKMGAGGVSFVKQYDGAHAVNYTGTINNQGVISGKWEIPGNCDGAFNIRTSGATHWNGTYRTAGESQDHGMTLLLKSQGDKFFGLGSDENGSFNIEGEFIPARKAFTFTKTYFGAHSVHYAGIHANGQLFGNWHWEGSMHGTFTLTKA